MEEKELKFKERILTMARSCPDARRILQTGFPEYFEPEYRYFKSGSLFYVDFEGISMEEVQKLQDIFSRYLGKHNGVIKTLDGNHSSTTDRIFQLQHHQNSQEYRLIHLATGYQYYGRKIYRRKPQGVAIPVDDLKGLKVFAEGCGK
jgi:hypothetical protein